MRVIFWLNMLSHHQVAHVKALAAQGHTVTIVADRMLSDDRQAMGWVSPDFAPAQVIVAPTSGAIEHLIDTTIGDAVNIIGGYRGYRVGPHALARCLTKGSRVGLMAEAGDPIGWQAPARRIIWRYEWLRFGRRIDFVLAIGQTAVRWFRSCGYAAPRIFPYGYFVERDICPPTKPSATDKGFQIAYVGRCDKGKGVDVAVRALAKIKTRNVDLTIMGEGPTRESLRLLAEQLGVVEQVRFRPFGPSEEVYQLLDRSDLLILPSRYDGWGVVVNEALLSGVPAVCTDRCGASDLLREAWRGQIVNAGSVDALADVLATYASGPRRTATMTEHIRRWSHCIQGDSAARYLIAVLKHLYAGRPRPIPPWYA